MAQNISLWGATYPDVPSVLLPKSGSGTALFCDPSETTATAADVAAGKLFLTAAGVLTQGTASGGGGGGLEYETGTYTPSTDIAQPTINFSKTHSVVPMFAMMLDMSTSTPSQNSNLLWAIENVDAAFGKGLYYNNSTSYYARVNYAYKGSSTASFSSSNVTNRTSQTEGSGYMWNWIRTTCIRPGSNSTSRYWRSGRTYNWIAVWAPTT